MLMFSPRMWRCFSIFDYVDSGACVFSTHVEMFLLVSLLMMRLQGFLHACGDVSMVVSMVVLIITFSPRMWRCFLLKRKGRSKIVVFSTHVEMFPDICLIGWTGSGFLHACGDVSSQASPILWVDAFSPRMWRCFQYARCYSESSEVFSTHVEMFLVFLFLMMMFVSFLHACGDVS